jgi:hypothetical protein
MQQGVAEPAEAHESEVSAAVSKLVEFPTQKLSTAQSGLLAPRPVTPHLQASLCVFEWAVCPFELLQESNVSE